MVADEEKLKVCREQTTACLEMLQTCREAREACLDRNEFPPEEMAKVAAHLKTLLQRHARRRSGQLRSEKGTGVWLQDAADSELWWFPAEVGHRPQDQVQRDPPTNSRTRSFESSCRVSHSATECG
jgi:hypothetical protein